jgi:hypothetical protein
MTHSELEKMIVDRLKGVTFVSARTETKQTALNKGRGENAMIETIGIDPDTIVKHTNLVFAISGGTVSYQDFVNNRLVKEAKANGKEKVQLKFEANGHKWGKLLHDNCNAILTHKDPTKGGRYMVAYCVANNKPKVEYTYNDQPINLTEARFDAYRKPARKEGENQGTENPIVIRDYNFNSFKEITIFGETYTIVAD